MVIAIIAILAAILFPVFARAREAARKSACQSNMKQLASAVLMYKQDYDETFPQYTWAQNRPGAVMDPWWWKIQPYAKNGMPLQCPGASDIPSREGERPSCDGPTHNDLGAAIGKLRVSYGFDERLVNDGGDPVVSGIRDAAKRAFREQGDDAVRPAHPGPALGINFRSCTNGGDCWR